MHYISSRSPSLPHSIVALVGPIASGKSTISDILLSLLARLGHQAKLIHNLRDLYLPAAQRVGVPLSAAMPRHQITEAVLEMQARFGSDMGTHLLYEHLRNRPNDTIYVLDGKRDINGLLRLRSYFPNLLIIGLYASPETRAARIVSRQKAIDGRASGEISAQHVQQDDFTFNIIPNLSKVDVLIDTDSSLPFRLEMKLLEILQNAQLIDAIWAEFTPVQPLRKAASPPGIPSLTRAGYRKALDAFATNNADKQVIVVQGGNRFAAHYLRTVHNIDTIDMKLSGLMKQHPSVLLATMLTPYERIKSVEGTSHTTTAELLQLLPQTPIPFTQRTSTDRLVESDFASLQQLLLKTEPLTGVELAVSRALRDTAIGRQLSEGAESIAFLDDILYRGRTLHSAWYVLRMFDLVARPWRLNVFCADRASRRLYSPLVEVLCPGQSYPFENCARSAQGYYDLIGPHFEYRDLSGLRQALSKLCPDVLSRDPRDAEWRSLLAHASCLVLPRRFSRSFAPIAEAIAEIAVHQRVLGTHGATSARGLADQRAIGIGYCPAFLSLWNSFISQEQPVRRRERFKRVVMHISSAVTIRMESPIFEDLCDLYREIYARIWYNNTLLN